MPCELGVLEPRRLDDRPVMLDGQNKFVQLGSAGVDDADSGTATWQWHEDVRAGPCCVLPLRSKNERGIGAPSVIATDK